MKKLYVLPAIGLFFFVFALAAPNFSGTWVLDTSKSDPMGGRGGGPPGGGGGGPIEIVIKQTGTELTITRSMMGNTFDTVYDLDGAEHTATSQRGDLKYKAAWNGDVLNITGTRTTQRGEMAVNERYSLSTDGKELTITTVSPQGERKQVYTKK